MASLFASQLREIAANSTHELDLKARRTAHAESLLFPRDIAVKQDFESIFAICIDGYRDLCALNPAFRTFEQNLFSPQSKNQDRDQMNKKENEALDIVIEKFLAVAGSALLLRPGVKALEWLVRRFKIHVYNVNGLLLTLIPYHEVPIWKNVLSIVPQDKIVGQWKFLRPYLETTWTIPRHAVIYAASHNDSFFAALNKYVVDVCREGCAHSALMRFWGPVVTEAVSSRLDQAKSGRKEVQQQRVEDALLKILPFLSDGMEVTICQELTLTCFTVMMIIAAKANLNDQILDSLIQTVAQCFTHSSIDYRSALITISVLANRKTSLILPKSALLVIEKNCAWEKELAPKDENTMLQGLFDVIINSIMTYLGPKDTDMWLSFLEQLLQHKLLQEQTIDTSSLRPILGKALALDARNGNESYVRTKLIEILRKLNNQEKFSLALSQAAKQGTVNVDALEALFETTLVSIETPPSTSDIEISAEEMQHEILDVEAMLQRLPQNITCPSNFWYPSSEQQFELLSTAFKSCGTDPQAISKFLNLDIWEVSATIEPPLTSFLLRSAYDQSDEIHRLIALRSLRELLKNNQVVSVVNVIPHILVMLADRSKSMRSTAADLLLTATNRLAGGGSDRQQIMSFYGNNLVIEPSTISLHNINKIITRSILPSLEECVIDPEQIHLMITTALGRDLSTDIKKTARHEFFDLLVTHTQAVPRLGIKLKILLLLQDVRKVGNESKFKRLSSLLDDWCGLDEIAAIQDAQADSWTIKNVDNVMLTLIDEQAKDSLSQTTAFLAEKSIHTRESLFQLLCIRLREMWNAGREADQIRAGDILFEAAFSSDAQLSRGAREILSSVTLPSECLASFINKSSDAVSSAQMEPPTKRRRRSSHGRNVQAFEFNYTASSIMAMLTFALELVDSSQPQMRPEMVGTLFDALSVIHQLSRYRFEVPYLLNLCLSSIHAVMDRAQATKSELNFSEVRPELVTDCLRTSDNIQVFNSALSVSALLSIVAPDRMVHNIMPVFTFMGKNMFEKDDEHSVNVMNQAIDQIVPAIVGSLRKTRQKQNLLDSVAKLLASFITAYDHIPQHRRVVFYQRLLKNLGAEEFGYVLVAMLALQKHDHSGFSSFINDLLGNFPCQVRLNLYSNLVALTNHLYETTSHPIEAILNVSTASPKEIRNQTAKVIFQTAELILQSRELKSQILRISKVDSRAMQEVRTEINVAFRTTLAAVYDRKQDGIAFVAAKDCLNTLLQFVPVLELLTELPHILSQLDDDLKAYTLRILSTKIGTNATKDPKTRHAALATLDYLGQLLTAQLDTSMLQAILSTIDCITEHYGRKDLDRVLAIASTIVTVVLSTDENSDSGFSKLIPGVLTLTTMIEVLKENAVPIAFEILPKLQKYYHLVVIGGGEQKASLFNSTSTLLSTLVTHVPFALNEHRLADLMRGIVNARESLPLSAEVSEPESDLIHTFARKVDLDVCIQAVKLSQTSSEVSPTTSLTMTTIDLLSEAIERSSKSVVIRNAEALSDGFLQYLEAEILATQSDHDLTLGLASKQKSITSRLMDLSIKFIYKLSDSTFRPIFESWIDWTSEQRSENVENDSRTQVLRRTALFKLLINFFSTLKAIVTSYASYLINPVSEVLKIFADSSIISAKKDQNRLELERISLFQTTLTLLHSIAAHDADGFFTAPSHFDRVGVPLVSCLKLAANKSLRPLVYSHVIPTIVSLASATVDAPAHHHTISHHITQLRHHELPQVRLASIKTLHALLDDEIPSLTTADRRSKAENAAAEGIAEEWIANTIGVGSGEGEGARGGGSAGEVMIYVNEMLEDDDEDVERETRRWVQRVRERVGEDVFEV